MKTARFVILYDGNKKFRLSVDAFVHNEGEEPGSSWKEFVMLADPGDENRIKAAIIELATKELAVYDYCTVSDIHMKLPPPGSAVEKLVIEE